jgi:hypothetical protein
MPFTLPFLSPTHQIYRPLSPSFRSIIGGALFGALFATWSRFRLYGDLGAGGEYSSVPTAAFAPSQPSSHSSKSSKSQSGSGSASSSRSNSLGGGARKSSLEGISM